MNRTLKVYQVYDPRDERYYHFTSDRDANAKRRELVGEEGKTGPITSSVVGPPLEIEVSSSKSLARELNLLGVPGTEERINHHAYFAKELESSRKRMKRYIVNSIESRIEEHLMAEEADKEAPPNRDRDLKRQAAIAELRKMKTMFSSRRMSFGVLEAGKYE